MKQPELGKKIVELRKIKGLTQEQLVEKCHLNVRTLQRIESGEVSPRSYTIRTIFSSLEYPMPDLAEHGTSNQIQKVGDVFYKAFDLAFKSINLKPRNVKKIVALSGTFLLVLPVLLFYYRPAAASTQDKATLRTHIERANHTFVQRFNAEQMDSVVLTYHENAKVIFGQSLAPVAEADVLPAIQGRKGIKSYYTLYHMHGMRFLEKKSKSMMLTDSVIVDIGIVRYKKDNISEKEAGTYFTQWHYRDGDWKVENEMFNF